MDSYCRECGGKLEWVYDEWEFSEETGLRFKRAEVWACEYRPKGLRRIGIRLLWPLGHRHAWQTRFITSYLPSVLPKPDPITWYE